MRKRNIFITSDTWFNRPFGENINETTSKHNIDIIEAWNNEVKKNDIVYILGGMGIGNLYDILYLLNGEIHILNNYYTNEGISMYKDLKNSFRMSFDEKLKKRIIFEDNQVVVLKEHDIVLSYLPLNEWYGKHTGTYCFHGMDYNTNMKEHNINCNCKFWDLKPVNIKKVVDNIGFFKKLCNKKMI